MPKQRWVIRRLEQVVRVGQHPPTLIESVPENVELSIRKCTSPRFRTDEE